MEMERFIEEDMTNFLQEKVHERATEQELPVKPTETVPEEEVGLYAPTKNYEQEMEQAVLDANKLKAQRLMSELKEQHDSYPADAPERLERKRLLEQLYKRYQESFGHESGTPTQEETKPAEAPPAQEPSPEPPQETPSAEPMPSIPPAATPQEPAAMHEGPGPEPQRVSEDELAPILATLDEIEALVTEHAYSGAMKKYHELKGTFSLENLSPQQRDMVLPRMKELFRQIHKQTGAETGKLGAFHDACSAIRKAVESGDVPNAMRQYKTAREHATSEEQKESLKELYDMIRAAQSDKPPNVLDEEEKRLLGKP